MLCSNVPAKSENHPLLQIFFGWMNFALLGFPLFCIFSPNPSLLRKHWNIGTRWVKSMILKAKHCSSALEQNGQKRAIFVPLSKTISCWGEMLNSGLAS